MLLIEDIRVMCGPNIWSNYRKNVIQVTLDLQEYEQLPTNKIDGFSKRIEDLLPTLYGHECSEQKPGGFFERVKQGTWLGHVVEHITLELLTLAGGECGYGRTRSTHRPGVYYVVFDYDVEDAGIYAVKAAVRITEALAQGKSYSLNEDLAHLRKIYKDQGLGPTTRAIVNEAVRRRIPYRRLNNDSSVLLGYGKNQKKICAATTSSTSSMAVDLASDKDETKSRLKAAFIPVPRGKVISLQDELLEAIDDLGFPLVLKPVNGNHGRGITVQIQTIEEARAAFDLARSVSSQVIIEKYIRGADYRFLVVNYKFVAAAQRMPAMITGDGRSTIRQLIDQVNGDSRRGNGHEKVLTSIKVDDSTIHLLKRKHYNIESVLPANEQLFLKDTANLSTGGTATDITDLVHPLNARLAERTARLIGLDICGIDIIAEDVSVPITGHNGAVVEVNAGPGLRMHLNPSAGQARNVAEPIIDMLYPNGSSARIPIVAVTGTNGKTTTARLIAHIACAEGMTVGLTTTDGIYIKGDLVHSGDCSGPSSAMAVLSDPLIEFAVLECARGGILRAGLGFDECNTSIVTNISEDHLGLHGIESLRDLAKVKAVVPRSTCAQGYAILNADDDLVYSMEDDLDCRIAFFSMRSASLRIQKHCAKGGIAATYDRGYILLHKGQWTTKIARVTDIPLTHNGRAESMINNVLPALLAAVVNGFSIDTIRKGLSTFIPSPSQTPGRMNIFKFEHFELMIDYAHNPDGFRKLKSFVQQTEASIKVCILGCAGDRRDMDIVAMGAYVADAFDEIIIRHDRDKRGRTNEDITRLIVQGIRSVVPYRTVQVISDEIEALQYALHHAMDDSFIVHCADDIHKILDYATLAWQHQTQYVRPRRMERNNEL